MNRILSLSLLCGVFLIPVKSNADIYISEIDLTSNIVEVINDGGADVDMSTWWMCNRVNGSPFYGTVASGVTINAASFEASGVADLIVEAGDVLVLDVLPGYLPDASGEFAFYNTNSFTSSAAIEDYVAYGAPGIRDSVAQGAGIWTDNEFIDLTSLQAGESIQLINGQTGVSPSDYFFDTPSFGSIPEPTTLPIVASILGVSFFRRRRQ